MHIVVSTCFFELQSTQVDADEMEDDSDAELNRIAAKSATGPSMEPLGACLHRRRVRFDRKSTYEKSSAISYGMVSTGPGQLFQCGELYRQAIDERWNWCPTTSAHPTHPMNLGFVCACWRVSPLIECPGAFSNHSCRSRA